MNIRTISGGLAALFAAGSLCLAVAKPAEARHSSSRERAWRIGTYAGAAGTAAALATGHGTWGLIGAGATALSYSQWRREMRRRHQSTSYARYRRYRYARHHHHRYARRY